MARTLKLIVEYEGTQFHGWQVQNDVRTVQGELEAAFEQMTHTAVRITGAGRTDAGVHAMGQVAHLKTDSTMQIHEIVRGFNAITGHDVAVRSIEEVDDDFSARFSARGKLYRYAILNRPEPAPLLRRSHLHIRKKLDLAAMRQAAEHMVGTHDFSAFRAADCERDDPRVTITALQILRDADEILIEVTGYAFLKNMVRIIAGTLVDIGRGRLDADVVPKALESGDRTMAGPTAQAHGLTLVEVFYDPQ